MKKNNPLVRDLLAILEPKEQDFLNYTILPELENISLKDRNIILERFRIIAENREQHPSSFPLDKEYDREHTEVEGVRRVTSPEKMLRLLVTGIISDVQEKKQESATLYQPEFLHSLRSSINRKRLYAAVKDSLIEISSKQESLSSEEPSLSEDSQEKYSALKRTITALRNPKLVNNKKLDAVTELIAQEILNRETGKNSSITNSSITNQQFLVARTNRRTIDLSRDNGCYGCCAFWGTGEGEEHHRLDIHSRYYASQLYLADPEIGLLFTHIEKNNALSSPTGVIIMASLLAKQIFGAQTGREERILLVDSIEAYRPKGDSRFPNHSLREFNNDAWRRINYNALFGIAKDIGAEKIVYNDEFWNQGGNTFTNYFLERTEAQKQTLSVRKENARTYIPDTFVDRFGFFLDALLRPEDYRGEHAIRGSYDCSGTVAGWVVDVR